MGRDLAQLRATGADLTWALARGLQPLGRDGGRSGRGRSEGLEEVWRRAPVAALGHGYRRRQPEATVLHQSVRGHLSSFLAERGGLPRFVARDFTRYLECGCWPTALPGWPARAAAQRR